MSSSILRRATLMASLLASLLLISGGCASSGGAGSDVTKEPGPSVIVGGKTVSSISISASDSLAQKTLDIIEKANVANEIETGIRRHLNNGRISDSGSLAVDIEIVSMRVRSWASVFLWGAMAGADWITVIVTVTENGQQLKTFRTGTSTIRGGWSVQRRISRLLTTLSKRISTGI